MDGGNSSTFGIVDYCMLVGVLVITCGIALFTSCIKNKTPEEFLMGTRSFKPFPVVLSLLTSYISSLGLLGYSGEVYANGMQISTVLVGIVFAILISSYLFLPVLYPLKLLSVNEYIELRFKSKRLWLFISFLSILKTLVGSGIILYAPTITLAYVTGLNTLASILLLGVICTLYSSLGGFRAVIWTDVFQLLVIVIGMAALTTVGISQNGGVIETLFIASKGERLQFFNMNPSPFVRHTFFNTILSGTVTYLHLYTSEQICFQRICAVNSIKYARRVLSYNVYGVIIIHLLMFSSGLIAYANYAGCDPMALGLIKRQEEIIPYFVMENLSFIPGFPGILVATMVGGSLSTVSSGINGCAAMIWRDICLRFTYFQNASDSHSTLINKIISLVVGSLLIGIAILSSNAGSLVELSFTIFGTLNFLISGTFMIGIFLPKCNIKGIWTGLVLSYILTTWIALGGLFYKKKSKMLPFSVQECENSNLTYLNASTFEEIAFYNNGSVENSSADTSNIASVYQISYTLYGAIGALIYVSVAVTISFITGNQDIHDTSPKFISPIVQKFYWTKEEISRFEEGEFELNTLNITLKENTNTDNSLDALNTSVSI